MPLLVYIIVPVFFVVVLPIALMKMRDKDKAFNIAMFSMSTGFLFMLIMAIIDITFLQ